MHRGARNLVRGFYFLQDRFEVHEFVWSKNHQSTEAKKSLTPCPETVQDSSDIGPLSNTDDHRKPASPNHFYLVFFFTVLPCRSSLALSPPVPLHRKANGERSAEHRPPTARFPSCPLPPIPWALVPRPESPRPESGAGRRQGRLGPVPMLGVRGRRRQG
jgi:hypothetical protein